MGFSKLYVSFLFLILFTAAIVNYVVWYEAENETVVNLDSNLSGLSTTGDSSLRNIAGNMQNTSESFSSTNLDATASDTTTATGGIFKSLPILPVTQLKTIFTASSKSIFGGRGDFKIIFTTLTTILVGLAILYGWKVWKGGDPD